VLLLQPWLSAEGHPAQSTLSIARTLSQYIPFELMTFRVREGDHADDVINQLRNFAPLHDFVSVESVDSFSSIGAGSSLLLEEALSRSREIGKSCIAVFLDASIQHLARFSFFQNLRPLYRIGLIELHGPEEFDKCKITNVREVARYSYLRRFLMRDNVILGVRTDELRQAWCMSGLIKEKRCRVVPNLEVASYSPYYKDINTDNPPVERSNLAFSIVGQIRDTKNINRIVQIFNQNTNLGFLHISGFLRMKDFPEGIEPHNAFEKPRIICDFRMLSEKEMINTLKRSHYSLMLYCDIDTRMESSMLYTSVAAGVPVIACNRGWLARMVGNNGLGYLVDPYDSSAILNRLRNVALPGTKEYENFLVNIKGFLESLGPDHMVPRFLETFDYL